MSRAPNQSTDEIIALKRYPGNGVDRFGNVYSRKPKNGRGGFVSWRKLKLQPDKHKYLRARVQETGKCYEYAHRLVLEAFVGPCPDGMECRHLDGDPANNKLENLRWGTSQENAIDRGKHGKVHSTKLNQKQVSEIRSSKAPQRALAEKYNIDPSQISRIRNRKMFKWVT